MLQQRLRKIEEQVSVLIDRQGIKDRETHTIKFNDGETEQEAISRYEQETGQKVSENRVIVFIGDGKLKGYKGTIII